MSRPLVAYCVFGATYARFLHLSLWSLLDVGAYQGDVLIVTDLTTAALEKHCPLVMHRSVKIAYVRASAGNSAKLARYQLHRCFNVAAYAPILYVDCDIVFDRPVARMLDAIATNDRICFPAELGSSVHLPSMAGWLAEDEGFPLPDRCGFNSGTMGIPDGSAFRFFAQLERVASTAITLWNEKPHLFSNWFDQPVVNFLHVKNDLFDTVTLTPFVRYVFAQTQLQVAPEHRCGLAHFFDADKDVRMRNYLESVSPTTFFDMQWLDAISPLYERDVMMPSQALRAV